MGLRSAYNGEQSRGLLRAQRHALIPGNIDLDHRPVVHHGGKISTVRSMSFGVPGGEVLLPTVSPEGRLLGPHQALRLYEETGQHLGVFPNARLADVYARALHREQAGQYRGR